MRVAQMLKPGQYVNLGMGIPTKVVQLHQPEIGHLHARRERPAGLWPGADRRRVPLVLLQRRRASPSRCCPARPSSTASRPSRWPAAATSTSSSWAACRSQRTATWRTGGRPTWRRAAWAAPWTSAPTCRSSSSSMEHVTREGELKILNKCEYPLTAARLRHQDRHRPGADRCHAGRPGPARAGPRHHRRVRPGAHRTEADNCPRLQRDGVLDAARPGWSRDEDKTWRGLWPSSARRNRTRSA